MNDPTRVANSADVASAAGQQWPVVVVGAGLAGATMAHALAGKGKRVLLIDRATFPRAKTCGGCLNPRAVVSLERLGLGDALAALEPTRLVGVEWRTVRGRRANLDFPAAAKSRACAVSRTSLDVALLRSAIEKGVSFLGGVRVVASEATADVRMLRVRSRDDQEFTLSADMVVACDGLGSVMAKQAGLSRDVRGSRGKIGTSAILPLGSVDGAPDDRILMACSREGYAGVVRVEDDQWDVAAAIRLDAIGNGVAPCDVAAGILARCGVSVDSDCLQRDVWTVTPPHLTRRVVRPWTERLLLVGDAAGYVEPITGEGMAWALAGVESVLPIVAEGWNPHTGMRWERAWRAHVARRTRLVRLVSRVAASPVAMDSVVGLMSLMPSMGRLAAAPLFRDSPAAVASR